MVVACVLLHVVHCHVLCTLSMPLAQVAKVSESDADYRRFYVESGATAMRLRAETKCAHGQGLAAAWSCVCLSVTQYYAPLMCLCAIYLCQKILSAEVPRHAQGGSQRLGGLPVCRQGVAWVMLQPSAVCS